MFVELALLMAAPVTVMLVIVLREDRTPPLMDAALEQGAAAERALVTSQVTVPLETVIVARTGAVRLTVMVPVVAACATHGRNRAASIAAGAAVVRMRVNTMFS
ncbi:MAG: hypothetical protein WCE44_07930 [Candidatus Velthaea sp.]